MKKLTFLTLAIITITFTVLLPIDPQNTYPMIENRVLGDENWGTHQTPLITAAMHTDGPILELGCGDFSTPLLHAICSVNQRMLVSADADKKWLRFLLDLENPWHKFIYVPVFENPKKPQVHRQSQLGNNTHWSIVFIDHAPGHRRATDIHRLRSHTDIFVVHDSHHYKNCSALLATFKYRFIYKRYKIETTVASDTIDVTTFFK